MSKKTKLTIKNKSLLDKMSDTDLIPEEIKAKNVKVRITTYIDLDIIEELKVQAAEENEKYQNLLNKYLRACVFKEVKKSDLRMLAIANS